jgi:opacity protein-like surface antigen
MNNPFMLRRIAGGIPVMALLSAVATGFVAGPAQAETYVGAAIGQGRITASDPALGSSRFNEHDVAFKIAAGSKKGPIGLELEYIDFGRSRGDLGSDRVTGKLNGLAAFAVLPLPDLVPVFDLYGKVGMGRLDTKVFGESLDFSSRSTEFAWGLGAQFKAGSIAVRAEYESFKRDGRNPALLSLGFVKYFGQE